MLSHSSSEKKCFELVNDLFYFSKSIRFEKKNKIGTKKPFLGRNEVGHPEEEEGR